MALCGPSMLRAILDRVWGRDHKREWCRGIVADMTPTPLMDALRRAEDAQAAPPPEPKDFLDEVTRLAPYGPPALRAALDQVDSHICKCEWCWIVVGKPRHGMPGAISRICANRLLESILDPAAKHVATPDGRTEIVSEVIDRLLDEAIAKRRSASP